MGTPREDSLSFYNARCKFMNHDWEEAAAQLDTYRRKFSRSPFIENAEGMYALCHYYMAPTPERDQSMTTQAIIAITEFMSRYPDSEYIPEFTEMLNDLTGRLMTKSYLNAYTYYKIGRYKSAIVAFKNALKRYPDSPYIAVLEQDIVEQEAVIDVLNKVEIASYPDIELQDMYRKKHRLASLSGGVTLLYFWISESALCNNINAELKELYERYHDKGFEVYHVSADADEAVWIDAVRQQRHPWISVYGGKSADVFTLFGVDTLPKAYIIDREGNVSVAPLAMDILEREIKRCL